MENNRSLTARGVARDFSINTKEACHSIINGIANKYGL